MTQGQYLLSWVQLVLKSKFSLTWTGGATLAKYSSLLYYSSIPWIEKRWVNSFPKAWAQSETQTGSCLIDWVCRIHWLHLCSEVWPHPTNTPISVQAMTLNIWWLCSSPAVLRNGEYSFDAITSRSTLIRSDCLVWFGLVWFYGISTIVGYLMPNLYTYISNIYDLVWLGFMAYQPL